MPRMSWDTLLNSERFKATATPRQTDERTQYQKDFDRIIYSSAFRRMQGKTQVYPLPNNDYVRTRLTHSIEASSVARSLGTMIGQTLLECDEIRGITASDVGTITAAATLAHDIGNPPFGHAGEAAFSDWYKRKSQDLITTFEHQQQNDLKQFEGNAQGFRTLTRLQNWRSRGGMQLTYATLGTFSKYPRASWINPQVLKK